MGIAKKISIGVGIVIGIMFAIGLLMVSTLSTDSIDVKSDELNEDTLEEQVSEKPQPKETVQAPSSSKSVDFEQFKNQLITFVDSVGTKFVDICCTETAETMTNYEAFTFCEGIDFSITTGNIHPEHPAIRWCDEFFAYYDYVYRNKQYPEYSAKPPSISESKDAYEFTGTDTCDPICATDVSKEIHIEKEVDYRITWEVKPKNNNAKLFVGIQTYGGVGLVNCVMIWPEDGFSGSKKWNCIYEGDFRLVVEAPQVAEWKVRIEKV